MIRYAALVQPSDEELALALITVVERLCQQPRAVVRDPQGELSLEMVLPTALMDEVTALLTRSLGDAWKPQGKPPPRLRWWLHPLRKALGTVRPEQTLYGRRTQAGAWGYAWMLPWVRQPDLFTLQIGMTQPSSGAAMRMGAAWKDLYAAYRGEADRRAAELQDALLGRSQRVVKIDPYSQYVVTPSYIGVDRRQHATRPVGKFLLRGKRAQNVTGMISADYYVDRIQPKLMRHFWALLALSAIDAVTTLYLVFGRGMREVNPLMQISLHRGALVFLGVKLLITAVFAIAILLHQHFRAFPWVLRAAIAGYVVLDVRALVLLFQ